MKIEKIEIFKGTVYYKAPFKISLGSSEQSDEVVIKIHGENGLYGIGEASPASHIIGETQETAIAASKVIASSLIGEDTDDLGLLFDKIDHSLLRNTSAKAAFDIALYDLISREHNVPLSKFLGKYRKKIETDVTIGIMDNASAVKKAEYLKKIGIKRIKMKVGEEINSDLKRVEEVINTVGNGINIFIDANQAWKPKEAISNIRRFESLGIDLVEQPVIAYDVDGLAFVRKNTSSRIMADESVHSPEDAIRVVKKEAADMINIKLMKSGGIHNAVKIANISEAAGLPNMVGCMMEGSIAIAAGIHFSLSTKNVIFADLDSDIDMKNTLTSGMMLPMENGFRMDDNFSGLGNLALNGEEVSLVETIKEGSRQKAF
ncbi:MAG: dipeptide epimerase [Thermoplasmata archaeon]